MYCPRCGQQAAEEIRFCSRCGLPLVATAALVEAGGEPTQSDAGIVLTQRQRGVRKGLMMVAGGVFFFIIAILLTAYKEDLFPFLILGGFLMTAGVMRALYGLLLEDHKPTGKSAKSHAEHMPEAKRAAELPPARTVPAHVYAKPGAQTSDMAAVPSITESTTRLLDEDDSGRRP